MLTLACGVAILALIHYLLLKKSTIREKDDTSPELSRTYFVDGHGYLSTFNMIRYYNLIHSEINRCRTKKQLENVYCMMEYFKRTWGKNELYNDLFGSYIKLTMIYIS